MLFGDRRVSMNFREGVRGVGFETGKGLFRLKLNAWIW